jgi:hypothetical protein
VATTMVARKVDPPPSQTEYQDPGGCLARLTWMLVGNLALVVMALLVYKSAGWSIADLAYWLIAGVVIGARYIDIVRFKGTTIHEVPATMADFRRYALLVLAAGAALFAVARTLGPGFR